MNSLIELGFSQRIEQDLAKAIEYDIIFLFLQLKQEAIDKMDSKSRRQLIKWIAKAGGNC